MDWGLKNLRRRLRSAVVDGSGSHNLPVEASADDRQTIELCRPYTMTSDLALWAAIQAATYVEANKIPGAIVECGVWRGGSAMAMMRTLLAHGHADRPIWLYDTFDGMTQPSSEDRVSHSGLAASEIMDQTPMGDGYNVWARASLDDVKRNLALTGYPLKHVTYVKGDVRETLDQRPTQIAVLRLDTDFYDSTRAELDALYDLLVPGGVCIIDDYGFWEGARLAVDEFLSERALFPLIHAIDHTARMWVKRDLTP